MNKEIKEILDRLFVYKNENDEMKYQPEDILTIDDVWLLLDYITNLQEENKEAHDFDKIMKDIKENLIARINRQECEIHNLKAKLEMYENGVYFSSVNDELQQRIDKAIEYLEECESMGVMGMLEGKYAYVNIPKAINILQGVDKE